MYRQNYVRSSLNPSQVIKMRIWVNRDIEYVTLGNSTSMGAGGGADQTVTQESHTKAEIYVSSLTRLMVFLEPQELEVMWGHTYI